MARFPFLSVHWIIAAREIHDEFKDHVAPPSESLQMNVTVIDAPFSHEQVLGHIDSTAGSIVPNEGHIDEADLSVTVPYRLARELLLGQQLDAIMIAFMSGEIEVQGDITRILSLQDIEATSEQQALAESIVTRLTAITE